MFRVHDAAGEPITATFDVEAQHENLSLVLHSAGGGASRKLGGIPRNVDYPQGLELLLRRLGQIDATLTDAYVDSDRVQALPVSSRRLEIQDRPYPIHLADVDDYDGLRRGLTRAQRSIGSTASSGGNERRRIRLVLTVPTFDSSDASADRLALVIAHTQDGSAAVGDPQSETVAATPPQGGGQGFITDTAAKLAIEAFAMSAARTHYEGQGWTVEDVSSNRSYDLLCSREGVERRVEVKGSTRPLARVLLTPNEVSHALANADVIALFVLSDIYITTSNGTPVARGGTPTVFDPWTLDPTRLSPTGYSYTLD